MMKLLLAVDLEQWVYALLLSLQQPNSGSSSRPSNGDKGEIVVENDWVSVEMNDYEVSLPL